MTAKSYKLEPAKRALNGAAFMPYLYAAYGMNTSRAAMAGRCPFAEPAGTVILRNHRLVFRGVADVVPAFGRSTHLALWRLTEACEAALDRLEGYRPNGSGMYDKRYFRIVGDGPLSGRTAMIYVMSTRDWEALPSNGYESMLRAGYADFAMPSSQIDTAMEEARKFRRKADYRHQIRLDVGDDDEVDEVTV